MHARRTPDLDRVRELIADGFWVTDVDSTDDHLVLVLGRDRTEHTILLDHAETQRLVEEEILSRAHTPMVA